MTATRNDRTRMHAPVIMRFPLRFARRHETPDRNYYTVRNITYSSCSGQAGNRGREKGKRAVKAENAGCDRVAGLRNPAGEEINPIMVRLSTYMSASAGRE